MLVVVLAELLEKTEDNRSGSQTITSKLIEISGAAEQLEQAGVVAEPIPDGLLFVDQEGGCLVPMTMRLAEVELVDCVAVVWGDEEEVLEIRNKMEACGLLQEGMFIIRFDPGALSVWIEQHDHGGSEVPEEDLSMKEDLQETRSVEYVRMVGSVKEMAMEDPGEFVGKYQWIDAKLQNISAGLDVLLVASDAIGEEKKFKSDSTGLVLWGGQFGKSISVEALEPIANVVGFIYFEESVPMSERKRAVRKVQASVRKWLNDPKAQVLAVSPSLVEAWKEKGVMTVAEEEIRAYLARTDEVEQVDHGFYASSTAVLKVELLNFETIPTIGGTQLFLKETTGKLSNVQVIDFGWNFGIAPYMSTMMGRPPWRDGLEPYLRTGLFPRVSRLYRTDALLCSINPQLFNSKDETGMFILAEIYQRLGLKEMKEEVKRRMPRTAGDIDWREWKSFLDAYKKKNYDGNKSIYNAVIISHAHQDHATGVSLLRDEIPAVVSPWTWLLLMTDYVAGWHWTVQETLVQKTRYGATTPGVSLPTTARPVAIMHDGEEIMLTPNVRLLTYEGYHSIPGVMPQLYEVLDHGGEVVASFAYPGDYRYDPHFFEEVGKRGVHTLFVEGTNIPGGHKLSAKMTEVEVAVNIAEVIENTSEHGLPIIRLVKGNVERLNNIIEAADGRQVVVSRKVARLLHMASIYTAAHGEDWWGRVRPPSLSDGKLAIYRGNKQSYYMWEKELMGMPDYQVVDDEEISMYPGKYVLVMDHRDRISAIKVGGRRVEEVNFVDSVYWVYDSVAKMEAKFVMDMCDQLGWTYHGDMERGRGGIVRPARGAKFHASGHIGSFDDQVSLIKMTGAERLIVGHSEHPEIVARELTRAFPKKEVIQKMKRPWARWEF